MTAFDAIELLFPVVLGLHTREELGQREAFVQRSAVRWLAPLADARTLAGAAAFMLLSAATVSALAYAGTWAMAPMIIKAAIFALLFNALGHIGFSLVEGKPVPGTFTAVCLLLPYSATAIALMRALAGESAETLLRYAAAGAVGMPLATLAFLLLGRVLTGGVAIGMRWSTAAGRGDRSC